MPGSYPDPRSYANTALQALEEAYEENFDSHTGNLILTAIQAIKSMKKEFERKHIPVISEDDPYEVNYNNSAI